MAARMFSTEAASISGWWNKQSVQIARAIKELEQWQQQHLEVAVHCRQKMTAYYRRTEGKEYLMPKEEMDGFT